MNTSQLEKAYEAAPLISSMGTAQTFLTALEKANVFIEGLALIEDEEARNGSIVKEINWRLPRDRYTLTLVLAHVYQAHIQDDLTLRLRDQLLSA